MIAFLTGKILAHERKNNSIRKLWHLKMNKFHSWSTFEEYIRNCNPSKGQSQSESYHWKSLDKKTLFITFISTLSNFFGDTFKLSSSRFSVRTRMVRLASDTRKYRKILWRSNRFFYGFGNELLCISTVFFSNSS